MATTAAYKILTLTSWYNRPDSSSHCSEWGWTSYCSITTSTRHVLLGTCFLAAASSVPNSPHIIRAGTIPHAHSRAAKKVNQYLRYAQPDPARLPTVLQEEVTWTCGYALHTFFASSWSADDKTSSYSLGVAVEHLWMFETRLGRVLYKVCAGYTVLMYSSCMARSSHDLGKCKRPNNFSVRDLQYLVQVHAYFAASI